MALGPPLLAPPLPFPTPHTHTEYSSPPVCPLKKTENTPVHSLTHSDVTVTLYTHSLNIHIYMYTHLPVECPKLPAHKAVIEGVHVGGDEAAAPVHPTAHGPQVTLSKRGEVLQPVGRLPVVG